MPNISRIRDNQTMKFGQLIECNMKNIFLEKSYTKCDGQTSHRPFSEKLKFTFFSTGILLHTQLSNIKTLSPGTNILGVPGKNIKTNS